MRVVLCLLGVAACSGRPAPERQPSAPPPPPPVVVPAPTCNHVSWHYALTAGSFEPTQDITSEELRTRWRAGTIAASAETEATLAPVLGTRTPVPTAAWTIVPVQELTPRTSVVTVDGVHPLEGEKGPLVVERCADKPNFEPAHLTKLVMSGTTALTGRTAERLDEYGVANTLEFIAPFFTSADLVHISNEVAFVHDCHPRTGQQRPHLKFCARDRYVEVLEALHTKLIELTGSHLVDYGRESLLRTIAEYEKRGYIWFGGGRTQLDATAPKFVDDHGNKLAFVGCNAVNWWVRGVSLDAGTADCDWPRMVWQIQDLRRRGYSVIATVQHRELREHAPPPDLVEDLRRLAEAGAIFVLGSQAHVAHPWDVHFGAYVHYGPGNILFAQYPEVQREASVDKAYIYEGKLLTVSHLFVRTDHGLPHLLSDAERTQFLGELQAAATEIAPPDPDGVPALPPIGRDRPDSVIVDGRAQHLVITAPAQLADNARYPLVIDMAGTQPADDGAFVVWRRGKLTANADQIRAYMASKYPIDPDRVVVDGVPLRAAQPAQPAHHHHHHHHHHAHDVSGAPSTSPTRSAAPA